MAQSNAPTPFGNQDPFVDATTFRLTDAAAQRLFELWRQICAGFVITPVKITQASSNLLNLAPLQQKEGAAALATGMAFFGVSAAATTGAAQAQLGSLSAFPVYKNAGRTITAAGDILANDHIMLVYSQTLAGGTGGFVLK